VIFLIVKAAEFLGKLGGDRDLDRLVRAAREADARRAEEKTAARSGGNPPENQQ